MAKLKPLIAEDPILRKVSEEISLKELKKVKTQKIIEQMLQFIKATSNKNPPKVKTLNSPKGEYKGKSRNTKKIMVVGLSANQVGILKRISVVDLGIGQKRYSDHLVLVNPKIIANSKSTFEHREGCVNLPNTWGMVKRYKTVKVQAFDRSGNKLIIYGKGWLSILLQHEIGHLNGELFIDFLENPKKAFYIPDNMHANYKENFKNWDKFIDVSHLTAKTK